MIIGRELMIQLGLTVDFKRQVFQWYGTIVHMKEPSGLLGQSDLNKREMRKVVTKTAEPAFTREATEWTVKSIDMTYAKADINQVDIKTTQLNSELITLFLSLLKDF